MTAKLKCAVVGAGAAGAAAAYALTRRGAEVSLFEQFVLFHDRGSSHGPTRLFRTAYFEHTDYVPLLLQSAALWRRLEREYGEKLYYQTGVLMAGLSDNELIAGVRKAASVHNLSIETVAPDETNARFPWLSLEEGMDVLLERDAGFIRADKANAAFIDLARKSGAKIVPSSPVSAWGEKDGQVFIEVGDERFNFDQLVLTPGAFASRLLDGLGAEIKPLRKTLFWTAAGDARFHHDLGFRPFAVQQPNGRFFYGFPAIDNDGVKFGEHTGGAPVETPDDEAASAQVQDRADAEAFLKRHTPGLPLNLSKEQSCLYEMSPDGNFIIDRHPASDRVSFAIGLSGHGFKFAPMIGEALADLAVKGETQKEFNFLKLARFGG